MRNLVKPAKRSDIIETPKAEREVIDVTPAIKKLQEHIDSLTMRIASLEKDLEVASVDDAHKEWTFSVERDAQGRLSRVMASEVKDSKVLN